MDASNELTFRVYFEDTDAQGVVYYGNYLRYMERGRTEWLRDRKIQQSRLAETEHLFFTVSEMKLKYHQPARLDDIIFVRNLTETTAILQDAPRRKILNTSI